MIEEMSLEAIASHTKGHIKVADRDQSKAHAERMLCGKYLLEAQRRMLKTPGLTFHVWVKDNCPFEPGEARSIIEYYKENMIK